MQLAAGVQAGTLIAGVDHALRQQRRDHAGIADQDRSRDVQIHIAAEVKRSGDRHRIEAAVGGVDRVGVDEIRRVGGGHQAAKLRARRWRALPKAAATLPLWLISVPPLVALADA